MTLYGLNELQKQWLLSQIGSRKDGVMPGQFRDRPVSFLFLNESGETVPPYAVMRVTGIDVNEARFRLTIEKPDGTEGLFAFNTAHKVEPNESGTCTFGPVVIANYTGTVAAGDTVGVSGWSFTTSLSVDLRAKVFGVIDSSDQVGLFKLFEIETAIFKTVAGIGARSDADTPTGATCVRYLFDGADFVAYSPSISDTVYNMSSEAVAANTFIQCKLIDGAWFVDVEPCPP